jgi:hypothetical protein
MLGWKKMYHPLAKSLNSISSWGYIIIFKAFFLSCISKPIYEEDFKEMVTKIRRYSTSLYNQIPTKD